MATNRRTFFGSAAAGMAAAAWSGTPANAAFGPTVETPASTAAATKRYQNGRSPWPLALNSSTIRPVAVKDKVRVAAETGWDAIELWIDDLERFEAEGGNLKELAKEIRDRGLFVPNIIGLWNSMPEGREAFEASLKATRERMRRSADVGSRCVAAIPMPDRANFDLGWAAECYGRLLQIGRDDYGIIVAIEFVGFLKGVHRLGQAVAIALDADDPDACLIADTFHLYRGGSGFNGLKQIQGGLIADFHWNDVPGNIARDQLGDEHRLDPGDGILPLGQVLRDLKAIGYSRCLSLELFKRSQWEQAKREATAVAAEGRRKMLACLAAAGV